MLKQSIKKIIFFFFLQIWNLRKLGTILDMSAEKNEGIHTPYMYFGMWKTSFPWHVEDGNPYSINYQHFGASKIWYAIPPNYNTRFELLAKTALPKTAANCLEFLRHKATLIDPQVLRGMGIPVQTVVQEANEFIVTFPSGYHAGFNAGVNCNEAVNFATRRWLLELHALVRPTRSS
jgi:jumonji domain-containing protein 2